MSIDNKSSAINIELSSMKEIIANSELKSIQLDILDDVALFCHCNEIRYFLAYGTLLGAIRHHGYIPWDDDIDIAMPRPDYDRFLAEYKDRGPFELVAYPMQKTYALPFAKVQHKGTMMDEYLYKQDTFGVYIDVFPIDGFKNEKQVASAHYWRMILNAKKAVLFKGGRTFIKDVAMLIVKMLLCFTSVGFILRKIDRLSRMSPYDNSEKVGYIPTLNSGLKDIVDKQLLEEYITAEFEGKRYLIPKGYDSYLRSLYGEYMKLPPKEKQISHHTFKAWWK